MNVERVRGSSAWHKATRCEGYVGTVMREREKHRTHEVGFFSQGFIVIVCERRVCSVVFS